IHPQTVFHPSETVKLGIRGFVAVDELQIQVWQVQLEKAFSNVPLTTVLKFLDEVRRGWWHGIWELKDSLKRISPCLVKVSEKEVPITQRDAEGVFLNFLPVPLKSEGIYLVTISSLHLERIALVELTRVGLIVKLGHDLDNIPVALAYTVDLKTGEPVAGVEVSAWVSERMAGHVRDRKIASSTTDANGLARLPLGRLNLGNLNACFFIASQSDTEKLRPLAWVMMEEYELADALHSPETLWGIIYTDRPVYRPGNLVHFKGIVRKQMAKGYQTPESKPFTLLVRDPDGNIIHRTDVTLTDFGSFSGSLSLNEESPTGIYTIEAMPQNGAEVSDRITGSFTVAAYRKPEIQVTVKPTRPRFSRSDIVEVKVSARYYFGMPVAEAKVDYWVTRLPVVGAYEVNGWGEGYGGETVLEGTTRTDVNGQAVIRFRPTELISETPLFSEFRYEINVTIEAAGHQFAEGSTSFLVTQGDWKLTVWCEPSFAVENQKVTAKAKVVHWDTKKPQAKAIVHWRAGLIEWIGEDVKVRWQLQGQSETDANGEAKWQFVPAETGDWILEASVYDQRENAIGAEVNIWVVSSTKAPTLPPKLPPIQLWLDKQRYRVGEEAKIAVRSKLQNAAVLVTVEGERLYAAR
ncbi:MAG: MG2 domain-containing protein, partial [Armatimonadota bacterium]